MFKTIAKWTMAQLPLPLEAPLVYTAGTRAADNSKEKLPIFIHPKALTFPILVALAKGAWAAVSVLPLEWAKTVWFPFGACMILGLLVAISNLQEQKLRALDWITGLGIGLLNSLVVFGAVVGIRAL